MHGMVYSILPSPISHRECFFIDDHMIVTVDNTGEENNSEPWINDSTDSKSLGLLEQI